MLPAEPEHPPCAQTAKPVSAPSSTPTATPPVPIGACPCDPLRTCDRPRRDTPRSVDEPPPAPMPEMADNCRALLRTVGMEKHWADDGPDALAQSWLAGRDRPDGMDADAWTMLRFCWGIWTSSGLADELMALNGSALLAVSSFLAAFAVGGENVWGSFR